MSSQNEIPRGECLSEDAISGYLEGTLSPVVKAASEMHVATCARCREKLAELMRLLRTDLTTEEEAAVAEALVWWDRRNVSAVRARGGEGAALKKKWTYALVGIAALLALALFFMWRPQSPQMIADNAVNEVLARNRPVEARLSGQPYLPYVMTRGPETKRQHELLLETLKESASYHTLGRLYLAQRDFLNATRTLELAANSNAPPEVHNDLGVAYLYLAGDTNVDRAERALQLALKLDGRFAPAVYNLALVYMRKEMPEEAARNWQRYLELDPKSGWAEEAKKNLARVEFGAR